MDKTIELSNIVRESSFIVTIKSVYKVVKILVIGGAVLGAVEGGKFAYDIGMGKVYAYRDAYVMSYIEQSLDRTTFEFNDKGGAKQMSAMSRPEIAKAFYLLDKKLLQYEAERAYFRDLLNDVKPEE